jgi:hypothetical protein
MSDITNIFTAPDNVIEFVQVTRLDIVNTTDDVKVKLKALDGLASTALAQKKILSDENVSLADQQIAATLAITVAQIAAGTFQQGIRTVRVNEPILGTIIPVVDETNTTLSTLTIDDIQ